MDMARYVGMGGHGLEGLVRHILGMGCGEAHAHVGSRLGHHGEKLRETDVQAVVGRE